MRFKILLFFILLLPVSIGAKEKSESTLRGNGINFIENRGQIIDRNNRLRPDVLYVGDMNATKVYLRKTGVSYVMNNYRPKEDNLIKENPDGSLNKEQQTLKIQRIDMDFLETNEQVTVLKNEQVEGYFNYYLGHCPNGITNVHAYNKVVYQNIYNNIDIVWYGSKKDGLKYDILIKPGGNPNDIKIKYTGADGIKVQDSPKESSRTKLKIQSSLGEMIEELPKVYQNKNGKIIDVNAEYTLSPLGKDGEGLLNFKLGTFNSAYSLIIDPWITYCGGGGFEYSNGIAVDGTGNVVITGCTNSLDFPVSPGAFQSSFNGTGGNDALITKFDPDGNFLWSTYYGGSDDDNSHGIATDAAGNIAIAGLTASTDFPVPTSGVYQSINKGIYDAFLVKLNANGNRIWSTYCGGTDTDYGVNVATDSNNSIVITGNTASTDFSVSGAAQGTFGGKGVSNFGDVFVVKFNSNGNRIWSTYYGGNKDERGMDVAIDGGNNVIITGHTTSANFSVLNATQTGFAGGTASGFGDAFVIKLGPNGNKLWSTFYGGSKDEISMDIALDNLNNIVISGSTASTDFPVTAGAYQTSNGGIDDLFLSKFNSNGTPLWSTYFGGTFPEAFPSCSIDNNNSIYLLGEWEDADPGLVFSCGFQKTFGGGGFLKEDQFITKFNSTGKHICDTYLGGSAEDDIETGGGIACYEGFIYVTTTTFGTGYPVTTSAFQGTFGGSYDLTLSKLCGLNCGDPDVGNIDFTSDQIAGSCGQTVSFTNLSNFNTLCDSSDLAWNWTFPGGTPSNSTSPNPQNIYFATEGDYPIELELKGPCETMTVTKQICIEEIRCGELFIPTAFSPNTDGQNDILYVRGDCIKELVLLIYNRWGQVVFETTDIVKGWDGKYDGKALNTEVFAYHLKATLTSSEKIVKKGNVSLIR